MQTAPVLILFFNRPEVLSRLLRMVRVADPSAVYLACDGPRHDQDRAGVEACQKLASEIEWGCPVYTRYLAANAGCGVACSGAIDWFFSQENGGIVLEDDCHPDATFFRFATELLHHYAEHPQVFSISGSCLDLRNRPEGHGASYDFSRLPFCWGWAAWSRSWRRYRFRLDKRRDCDIPIDQTPTPTWTSVQAWRRRFRRVAGPDPRNWAYQWTRLHLAEGGLSVIPSRNLVCNVTASSATNMTRPGIWQDLPTHPMRFPMQHPERVATNSELDRHLELVAYNHRPWLSRKVWQIACRHGLTEPDAQRLGVWRLDGGR